MIEPHGGKLINRVASPKQKEVLLKNLQSCRVIKIKKETARTVENIAHGTYSPLTGFLREEDFISCLNRGRLKNGTPWTIPIVFDVKKNQIDTRQKVLLENGKTKVMFYVKEIFPYSKKEFAKKIFGTTNPAHPGVQKIYQREEYLAGGNITLIEASPDPHKKFFRTPRSTRTLFKKMGWDTIAAFQTRNVPHIGHEYLQKTALNLCDGLFINPVIGKKKEGDFKDELILKTYDNLIQGYYPKNQVVLQTLNYEMQYGGPREAIHHAIIRKNFGCTHFIVGRDHAGVGDFYHPFAAHEIFKKYPDLKIAPLFFSSFFHCNKCAGIASEKICPHTKKRVEFKGTMLREIITKKKTPPKSLMRPEIIKIIKKYPRPFV